MPVKWEMVWLDRRPQVESGAVERLLEKVVTGETTPSEAAKLLKKEPFTDLGFAKVDHHRVIRQGAAEVVYGEGKTTQQIHTICQSLLADCGCVLITRLDASKAADLQTVLDLDYHKDCRIGIVGKMPEPTGNGTIVVAAAGTSDLPVAEEAALTAEVLGNKVKRLYDVGVAGLHRLLANLDELVSAQVVIAVAGMEGALPSVAAGLVSCPVIAVPTSVGYGASFGGLSALLAMLNSCASGVSVVNIDNGFGAGFQAHQINHLSCSNAGATLNNEDTAALDSRNVAERVDEAARFVQASSVASDPTIAFAAIKPADDAEASPEDASAKRTILLDLSKSATRQSLLDQLEALLDEDVRNRRALILREARVPARHHHDLAEINETIDAMVAPEGLKSHLKSVYAILAQAEAEAHGVSVEEAHFHEVGNGLSILNALTIAATFFVLEPSEVLATAVQTGKGTVECAHGAMNIPAPATASILAQDISVVEEGNLIEGELCTPTSAAIIKHFVDRFVSDEEAAQVRDLQEKIHPQNATRKEGFTAERKVTSAEDEVDSSAQQQAGEGSTSKFPKVGLLVSSLAEQAERAIKDPAGFAASKTAPFPAAGAAADATVAMVPEDMLRLRDMLKAMNDHVVNEASEGNSEKASPASDK